MGKLYRKAASIVDNQNHIKEKVDFFIDTCLCVFSYHKQPKYTIHHNNLMSHVSVHMNHHQAFLIITI
jgi:hypothetical protein